MYFCFRYIHNVTFISIGFSKRLPDTYLGVGNSSLPIATFVTDIKGRDMRGMDTVTVSYIGKGVCVPVGETIQGEFRGGTVLREV